MWVVKGSMTCRVVISRISWCFYAGVGHKVRDYVTDLTILVTKNTSGNLEIGNWFKFNVPTDQTLNTLGKCYDYTQMEIGSELHLKSKQNLERSRVITHGKLKLFNIKME